jgi:O-methyltransferase
MSTPIATSPDEMLCISHHLRVLTSYGLRGSLTEFGCFKGFSSSCLSHTCHELGIELHVFDSFEGLPSSESSYYQAGEFAGTFEEVFRNIKAFGKIDNVQFFRGFFSVTVPGYDKQPLALWMDVDLASSAEDAMRMLSRMPAQGVVFSHEWPEGFIQGEIDVKHRHSDAVLPPVVSAFEARGGHPVGQFLCGRLGIIWDRKRGVRPLGIDSISALCNAI